MSLQVIYGRNIRRITLQRTLCSLIAFFPEKVSPVHLLVLYDNILRLQDLAKKDPSFAEKFGLYLKVQAYILQHHRGPNPLDPNSVRTLSDSFLRNIGGFLLEERHTMNELKRHMQSVEVRPSRSLGVDKSKLKPPRYIGVGYRDKGTARRPWIDGSPSWQEIARTPLKSLRENFGLL